jgi:hypothetical protein
MSAANPANPWTLAQPEQEQPHVNDHNERTEKLSMITKFPKTEHLYSSTSERALAAVIMTRVILQS